ncbi:hypothetical protein [uncultured Bartonella sp.]|uniref:hypothetical protein n=1 Tax=uncultured Bartonella sp. TaxID=104108 RepID=UPI0025FDC43B|nr:hypothetical protein [uncultured Bartonella sp.]
MTNRTDPEFSEKHRIRSRFFILLTVAIVLVILLVWATFEVLDLDGINTFNAIV